MKVFDALPEWRSWRKTQPAPGFVPTMGALHQGHLALVRASLAENPRTVVSIFVNPTQFDRQDDLEHYPKRQHEDLQLLGETGVDAVLMPPASALYPDDYRYRVQETELSRQLCGAHRPGHFDGVLSVVMKLLNLVRPARAYFGEKDYQQLQLVRGMVEAFFMDTRIVACPTVREPDDLALSSRNARLDPAQRRLAPELHRTLRAAADPASARRELERLGFRVDYVEDQGGRRLAAAHLGEVRLIDNVPLG
jgi:pantoate--beta-alanine ligase